MRVHPAHESSIKPITEFLSLLLGAYHLIVFHVITDGLAPTRTTNLIVQAQRYDLRTRLELDLILPPDRSLEVAEDGFEFLVEFDLVLDKR